MGHLGYILKLLTGVCTELIMQADDYVKAPGYSNVIE